MKSRAPVLVAALALVLVVGGAVLLLTADPVTFGWFAYAPLSGNSFRAPWALAWTGRQVVGAALAVLGLLLGAVAVGYLLGRRPPRVRGASVEPMSLDEAPAVEGAGGENGPDAVRGSRS